MGSRRPAGTRLNQPGDRGVRRPERDRPKLLRRIVLRHAGPRRRESVCAVLSRAGRDRLCVCRRVGDVRARVCRGPPAWQPRSRAPHVVLRRGKEF